MDSCLRLPLDIYRAASSLSCSREFLIPYRQSGSLQSLSSFPLAVLYSTLHIFIPMAPIGLKRKLELTPEPVPVCSVRRRPASVGFHFFLTFSDPRLTFLSVLGRRFRLTILFRFLQSPLSLRRRVISL